MIFACPPPPEPATMENPAFYEYVMTYDSACSTEANWDRRFPDVSVKSPDGRLRVTTSTALGGAIASLRWDGRELIASGGHGAGFQLAFHGWQDGSKSTECWNPTQAGSRDDDDGQPPPYHGPSTSALYEHAAGGATISTAGRPAMWLERASSHTGFDGCRPVDYQPDRSPFTFGLSPMWLTAQVSLAPDTGLPPNVVRLRAQASYADELYEHFDAVIIAYLQREFTAAFRIDPASGSSERLGHSAAVSSPTARCTPDGGVCLALWYLPSAMPAGAYYFQMSRPPSPYNGYAGEDTVQVTAPSRRVGSGGTEKLTYEVYAIAGDLETVARTVRLLARSAGPPGAPPPGASARSRLRPMLRVERATVDRRRWLRLRARVRPELQGSATVTVGKRRFSVRARRGRLELRRRLPRRGTFPVTVQWPGGDGMAPQTVRLLASRTAASLRLTTMRMDPTRGMLVRGRVARRARGSVTIEALPAEGDAAPVLRARAKIRNGRFALRAAAPGAKLVQVTYAGSRRRAIAGASDVKAMP